MTDANLAFAKLVANPTASAWSQAYDAGKLFAVLSLESNVPLENPDELNIVGKDVLATLEQEFFTLENKDLDSIKRAIGEATSRIKENLTPSFVIVYVVGNILYLFIYGSGKVVLKRGTKVGTLLEGAGENGDLKSASGYLQDKDVVILQTDKFSKVISSQTLAMSLDHEEPNEIAETLAPNVHEKEEGAAAALFAEYKEDKNFVAALEAEGINPEPKQSEETTPPPLDFEEEEKENPEVPVAETSPIDQKMPAIGEEEPEEKEEAFAPISPVGFPSRRRNLPFRNFSLRRLPLPHSRRVLLTVGIIILLIFVGSIFLAVNNKNSQANKDLFNKVFAEAQAKYDEGQGLVDLNKSLAREDFESAQKTLNDNKDKFQKGSSEEKQLSELLAKVNDALAGVSGAKEAQAKEINLDDSVYLLTVSENKSSKYFAQNAESVYFIDSKGLQRVAKSNSTKTQIVAKDWTEPGGLGVYLSNFYVLDKSDTILKFVPTVVASKSAYVKSDYLTNSPTLDDAIALAIDGSIYVLYKDSTIEKYNRGAKQTFSVKGLDKKFSNPTKIWTDTDSESIYVLDNGNSRIVTLDKNGAFQSAVSSSLLKNALDFEVLESKKTINFLSGGKAYSISI
jgi:hypothetical protein